jgi:hypothetical protein
MTGWMAVVPTSRIVTRKPRSLALPLAALAFVLALILSPLWEERGGPGTPSATQKQDAPQAVSRAALVQRAIPKLDWADAESRRIVGKELAAIDRFFRDAQRRSPEFAADVLGWGSKWRFVADRVPMTRGGRHDEFLRKAFNEHLFTPEQLTQVIEQAVHNELDALTGVENRMLVRIRADLEDLPAHNLPQLTNEEQWKAAYEQAVLTARTQISTNLKQDLSSEMVSLIAGEVMTFAAIRLGVSGGVLAAGAGSSLPTFGIGLVVSLIVDQVITVVWDWYEDPQGDLAAEVSRKLGEMRQLILEGDGTHPGLRSKVEQLARERSELRRQAVMSLLTSAGATE